VNLTFLLPRKLPKQFSHKVLVFFIFHLRRPTVAGDEKLYGSLYIHVPCEYSQMENIHDFFLII